MLGLNLSPRVHKGAFPAVLSPCPSEVCFGEFCTRSQSGVDIGPNGEVQDTSRAAWKASQRRGGCREQGMEVRLFP